MTTIISKVASNLLVSDSPWQFRILLIMVLLFFVGGLGLDFLASNIAITKLTNPADPELDKLLIEFTKSKHSSLTQSASLLYDFAKIALGALIASVTQNLKVDINTEPKNNKNAA